ncbi:importin subunit beta-3 [Coemansia spiralis]|uniref:Importin subunit beta-3 n=2 Tax=Coemansia TaxID=4863 RepID=A0A9W8G5B9_9FUNG|nr:importin subunit beta-3 [Coemansia umbellata]KAJ2621173.1 importin subunit beta-3 [Coemansia sp. RSA 1358]KAJ2673093.1 importin subunit beta-3 [Coemansia spiralis]
MSSFKDTAMLLKTLMSSLMSSDNDVRTQAESSLNNEWLAAQPQTLLGSLSFLVHQDSEAEARAFASILLRRIAFQNMPNPENKEDERSVWSAVPETVHQAVKIELLGALRDETDRGARHKLCDTISEVMNNEVEDDWPDLLPALYACAQDSNPLLRESAFRIFTSCAYLLTMQSAEAVNSAFAGAFQDSDPAVRLASLQAAVAYILANDLKPRLALAPMVPHMLGVLEPLYQSKDDSGLVDALTALMEAAEEAPKLFSSVLGNLIVFATNIGKDEELENTTRQTAVELLVTLAEAAPGMCRKNPQFCQLIVPVCMQMMSSIEDDDEWYTTDTLEDGDNEENYVFGEQTLDRLAIALGGKQLLPTAFNYIPQMLGSQEWNQRHAALMAISSIGEGCYKIMRSELQKILELIVPYFKDPHARVRYAVCNCVGQMATDFAPILQEKHHQLVLSNLIPAMDETATPRVQAHSAAAMVNFAEEATKLVLDPYLDTLFERLLSMLNSPKRYVQEQAITTIATIADNAKAKFNKYYSTIMPMLLNVLEQATDKEHRLLRGKAMECTTFIALAVGKEVFSPDIPRLVELLTRAQQSVTDSDDPQASYLQASWARLCKLMGPDFAPIMPVVMPSLIAAAKQQPDFAILEDDEDPETNYSAEDGWEFTNIGGQQIGIKTTALEEKYNAVELIISYAKDLGIGFLPYAAEILELIVPMFKFYFHEGVRTAAAAAVPPVLSAVKQSGDEAALRQVWSQICDKYIAVLGTEDDDTFTMQLFGSFSEAVEVVGVQSISAEQLQAFVAACVEQMNKYHKRMKDREAARAAEELDEDDEEQLAEEEMLEGLAIDEVSKALHSVFKTHGADFLPMFQNVLPVAHKYLQESDPAAQQWAICVFDDLVEYAGPSSSQYAGEFLKPIGHALRQTNAPDLRQAAAYGIGVMAQYGGDAYADFIINAALPIMLEALNKSNARDSENVYATENMVAAIAKILRFHSSKLPDAQGLLRTWFRSLPVCNDEDEAPATYEYLVQIINEQPDALLGGNDPQALRHLVKVVVEALAICDFSPELSQALVGIMQKTLLAFDDSTKASLWAEIPPEQQQALQTKGLI